MFDNTVMLGKRVMELEENRSAKKEELTFLRSKVSTQSRIIDTMSDNGVRTAVSMVLASQF